MNPSTFRSNLATQLAACAGIISLGAEIHRYPPNPFAAQGDPHGL